MIQAPAAPCIIEHWPAHGQQAPPNTPNTPNTPSTSDGQVQKEKQVQSSAQKSLAVFWELLQQDRLTETVFYDGSVQCYEDFYHFMCDPRRAVYVLFARDDSARSACSIRHRPLAMCWLDNRHGVACRIHFFFYRWAFGTLALETGQYVVHWLLHSTRQDGGYHLDTLIGVTPQTNSLAIRFITRLGFTVLGTIPHAIPLADGRYTDGVISYVTRDTYTRTRN